MTPLRNLSLRLRILLFFLALAAGSIGAVLAGFWIAYRRIGGLDDPSGLISGAAVAGFAVLGLVTWVWYLFDENVARAIQDVSGAMRARAHAGLDTPIDEAPARYLGDLAPAAHAVTAHLAETRNALAQAIQRETVRLQGEKDRLGALLADVPVGVVFCNGAHQVVFYNGQAGELLGAAAGLDRSIFDYLRAEPLRHARDRLAATDDPDAASDLMCATTGDARLLAGRMRLVAGTANGGSGKERPGYVLTLRDVTVDMAAHSARAALLDEAVDRFRRPAANLQTVIAALDAAGADAPALHRALAEEAARLASAVTDVAARHDAGRAGWWPLGTIRASDLVDAIGARIEVAGRKPDTRAAPLLIRCDGFGIASLVSSLAARLIAAGRADELLLAVSEDGPGAAIELSWLGPALPVGTLDRWLAEPLEGAPSGSTGRGVLDIHATECWPEARDGGRACIVLPLREARRAGPRPAPVARTIAYDFDLLNRAASAGLADTPLDALTCVVFDTETTGLLPMAGDEIVQIAALRIVNGRRVAGEVMNTLVNPGRPIPPGSTEVHGITDEMVADADDIAKVGRRFHHFAAGAVLVAHNAPFDMAFLHRHVAAIGAEFDNPILDTVLLSAVVFGQNAEHSLDALTHRLGVTIPEEDRHTALGDTVATAEAFLRLVPILKAKGIETFGQVLAEVRRHGRLLKDLNA